MPGLKNRLSGTETAIRLVVLRVLNIDFKCHSLMSIVLTNESKVDREVNGVFLKQLLEVGETVAYSLLWVLTANHSLVRDQSWRSSDSVLF